MLDMCRVIIPQQSYEKIIESDLSTKKNLRSIKKKVTFHDGKATSFLISNP